MNNISELTDVGMVGLMTNLETLRNEKTFVESTIPYTPKPLIDKIFNNIPPIKNNQFDTNIGVIYTIEMAFWLVKMGFTNVTMLVSIQDQIIQKICSNVNIDYRIISVTEENNNMPKFDVVVGNPPYKGKAQLHQQFFNLAVDITKVGGVVGFLQPATPYLNKKLGNKKHHNKMQDNLTKYITSVYFFNPNKFFTEAVISNILAVTFLLKNENKTNLLKNVIYDFNGTTKEFSNVALGNVTIHGDEINIVNSIKTKVENYIKENGSLQDIIDGDEKPFVCKLLKMSGNLDFSVRKSGNANSTFKADFFTFVPRAKEKSVYETLEYNAIFSEITDKDNNIKHVIYTNELSTANMVYEYCTTKPARFCLSLLKFTKQNHMGELKLIPLVDFNRTWSDKELYELLGITPTEEAFIEEFISDYYS